MKAIQDHPGHYFHTDDGAMLRFSEAHGDAPQSVQAAVIGRHGRDSAEVTLSECTLMAVGDFGQARPSGLGGDTKWTGASHRFGIYRVDARFGRVRILIFRTDGGGASFYLVDEIDALETWQKLALLPSELLWNLCMTITETHDQARRAERSVVFRLFLEGRLKKRRARGRVFVDVSEPAD